MRLDMRNALAFVFDVDINKLSACQACKDTLYAYIDAKLDGEDASAKFPQVKAHLDECLLCQQSYDELTALLRMERESQVIPPEPDLDFSYLNKPLWEVKVEAGKRVARLLGELRLLIRQGKAMFELPFYAPQLAYRLKSETTQMALAELTDKEGKIEIHLAVAALSDEWVSLTVRVKTLKPLRPVRRAQVTLNDLQGVMLQGAYTKANGQAEFTKIKQGDYLLIVKHKKRQWQIQLPISAESG